MKRLPEVYIGSENNGDDPDYDQDPDSIHINFAKEDCMASLTTCCTVGVCSLFLYLPFVFQIYHFGRRIGKKTIKIYLWRIVLTGYNKPNYVNILFQSPLLQVV